MVHAQVKMWTALIAYSSLRFLALIKDPVAKVSLYEHGSHLQSVLVSTCIKLFKKTLGLHLTDSNLQNSIQVTLLLLK